MKINITKNEYRLMLDFFALADWVMHAHTVTNDERHHEHEELRKKIYSFHKEMDSEDLIEFSVKYNDYHETQAYETQIRDKFLTPFEELSFWSELAGRLARRDVMNAMGKDFHDKSLFFTSFKMINDTSERYLDEFKKNGLNYLKFDGRATSSNNASVKKHES